MSGRLYDDAMALKVARTYEQVTEWYNMHAKVS